MARKKNSDERTHLFCLWAVLAKGEDGWTADDCGRGRLRARAGTRAWAGVDGTGGGAGGTRGRTSINGRPSWSWSLAMSRYTTTCEFSPDLVLGVYQRDH